MRDFQKIEWKTYNRPPFYQQWLCRDDTLKLATFGDRGLAEIDDQILALKEQWDLDNVKGHFLDRIGKFLSEARNGNTDDRYRIMLNLRRLLNTNDGSIPSTIKTIKFFYSSEIVHIVPDYPAGLIIEHDGEGTPGLNFNKLLAEIIPAGVSFSTNEIFYFTEELPSSETISKIKAVTSMMDYMGYVFHNGVYRRNGQIRHRYTGVEDSLSIKLGYPFLDQLFGRALQGGFVEDAATETWSFVNRMNYLDNLPSSETSSTILLQETHETLDKGVRRNGFMRRNGKYYRAHDVVDVQNINVHVPAIFDVLGECAETLTIGYRKHNYHNGRFNRNGAIKHDSKVLFPLEEE
jgi:hypothetical protein